MNNTEDCFSVLTASGLNLQAVFNIEELPTHILTTLQQCFDLNQHYRQLILIGHAGRALWQAIKTSGIKGENPIDNFSVEVVNQWFLTRFPQQNHRIVYPGDLPIALQSLGELAGWQHPSPFMLGINAKWGTWFAYRVLLLSDTDLPPTPVLLNKHPCFNCQNKPCLTHCSGDALQNEVFSLTRCINYRKTIKSECKTSCSARLNCPIGHEHRYCAEQIEHTYSISMCAIEQHCAISKEFSENKEDGSKFLA